MEAIRIRSGKYIKPSYTSLYSEYKIEDLNTLSMMFDDYISPKFSHMAVIDQIDIFQIYLEYFFRAIYQSYERSDGKLGLPDVRESPGKTRCTISSQIQHSGVNFRLNFDKNAAGEINNIEILIAEDDKYGAECVHASIGFTNIQHKPEIRLMIRENIRLVCKSIVTLNPDMAVWWQFYGVNLIDSAI